jgi:eukaryotic-like serine/threonine-protein kinase
VTTSSGDRARWARITHLFGQALDRPDTEREAFVRRAAGADTALAEEVLSLVQSHLKAGDFLEGAAEATVPDAGAALLNPNTKVGHYRIIGLLGAGGMGVVYLAEDTRLGRMIALKALAPTLTSDETRIARLRREARAAASLNHPNIATVFALEEIDGHLYIGTEYVPGETLRDELARGPLLPSQVSDTGIALAHALAAAHERGVVHRDLKPENVVRSADGRVKILDFGLAQFHDDASGRSALTGEGGVLGTPAYMSPEQIRGEVVDGRSDLFALGAMLYELTTGVHPFAAPTPAATIARILQDRPAPLTPTASGIPSASAAMSLNGVIMQLLEKAPDDRFASASAVAIALEGPGPADAGGPPHGTTPAAVWWWQFHQAAATLAYALLMVPLWKVRHMAPGGLGMILFLTALTSVVVAGALRLHGWFSARQYQDASQVQHRSGRIGVVIADLLFAAVLLWSSIRAVDIDDRAASLFVAAAASVAVSLLVVERATARAAWGDEASR